MSKLEQLIKKLCPDGVEWKTLEDCYEIYNGMTGVSLKWKETGNCRFIDYLNVYKNLKIDVLKTPFATVKNLKQNCVQKDDILVTTASEVPDECAITAVVEEDIDKNVFLDDHLFGLHLKLSEVNSVYVNYYMQTPHFRKDARKKVKGVTRFFVSPGDIGKIEIPLPPLPVQKEIVRILDGFTGLIDNLSDELAEREAQYEYYREKLLSFKKVK